MEKTLKFNTQIATSRVQSERLLALGLKKETADMKYPCTREYYGGVLTEGTSSLPIIIDTEDDDITEYDIPAWSLDRLKELYKCVGDTSLWNLDDVNYNRLIQCIGLAIKHNSFNKEYLV